MPGKWQRFDPEREGLLRYFRDGRFQIPGIRGRLHQHEDLDELRYAGYCVDKRAGDGNVLQVTCGTRSEMVRYVKAGGYWERFVVTPEEDSSDPLQLPLFEHRGRNLSLERLEGGFRVKFYPYGPPYVLSEREAGQFGRLLCLVLDGAITRRVVLRLSNGLDMYVEPGRRRNYVRFLVPVIWRGKLCCDVFDVQTSEVTTVASILRPKQVAATAS